MVGHEERPPAALPKNVQWLSDQRPDLGPLEGIRTGLASLESRVPYAFVTSCDAPNLRPELIRELVGLLGSHDAVVPRKDDRIYGMTAVYRTSTHRTIEDIYASGVSRRVSALQGAVDARAVPLDELKAIDPGLESFTNVNTAEAYFGFLKRHAMTCPAELAARLSTD